MEAENDNQVVLLIVAVDAVNSEHIDHRAMLTSPSSLRQHQKNIASTATLNGSALMFNVFTATTTSVDRRGQTLMSS